jgi:hypothetical protein
MRQHSWVGSAQHARVPTAATRRASASSACSLSPAVCSCPSRKAISRVATDSAHRSALVAPSARARCAWASASCAESDAAFSSASCSDASCVAASLVSRFSLAPAFAAAASEACSEGRTHRTSQQLLPANTWPASMCSCHRCGTLVGSLATGRLSEGLLMRRLERGELALVLRALACDGLLRCFQLGARLVHLRDLGLELFGHCR